MADVLLFHHAQGLTPGVHAFAETLRQAGHTVHVPDLYDGRTFGTLDEGIDHARRTGFATIAERGTSTADDLPAELVYAGFSLGVLPAQQLAQTRPGARGALLISACFPPDEFGGPWPDAVPVQIHGMDGDGEFADSGDLEAARELAASTPAASLFVYPGNGHLFADNSLPSYDPQAAALLTERVLAFLKAV